MATVVTAVDERLTSGTARSIADLVRRGHASAEQVAVAHLARIDRLVFGAPDPKAGFAGSLGDLVGDPRLNHRLDVTPGVLTEESAELLRAFFRERRGTEPV